MKFKITDLAKEIIKSTGNKEYITTAEIEDTKELGITLKIITNKQMKSKEKAEKEDVLYIESLEKFNPKLSEGKGYLFLKLNTTPIAAQELIKKNVDTAYFDIIFVLGEECEILETIKL